MLLRPGALLETPIGLSIPPIKFKIDEQNIKIKDGSLVEFNGKYHCNVEELERNRIQEIKISLVSSGSVLVSTVTDYTMSVPNGETTNRMFDSGVTLRTIPAMEILSGLLTRTERLNSITLDGVSERVSLATTPATLVAESSEQTIFFPVGFTFTPFTIKDVLSDEIELIFSCLTAAGIEVYRKTEIIQFNKIIDILLYPLLPPKLQISYAIENGFTDVLLIQQDPNAFGVQLYKKELNNSRFASWSLVKDVSQIENKTVLIKDRNPTANIIEYRAVSYNANNVSGFAYASATAEASRKPNSAKLIKVEDEIVISWDYSEELRSSIKLLVSNIPTTAISIAVLVKDLTTANDSFRIITNGFIPMSSNVNESIEFYDSNCIDNHVYEYVVRIQYNNGIIRDSETRCLVPFRKILNNIAKTSVDVIKETTDNDVSIDLIIDTNFIEQDEGLIKNALLEAGLFSFFSEDFTKTKLNSLVAFEIFRRNLITNVIEYLGTTTRKTINDKQQSKIFGCESAKPGYTYQYKINTFIRSSHAVLPETTEPIASLPEETFKPWFWQRPRVLKTGTLSSAFAEEQNFAGNAITQGDLVDVASVLVNIEEQLPNIINFEIVHLPLNYKKLMWTINGDVGKIDNFMIFGLLGQQKILLGVAHGFSGNKKFSLLFKTESSFVFERFRIIPFFNNNGSGREVEVTA